MSSGIYSILVTTVYTVKAIKC